MCGIVGFSGSFDPAQLRDANDCIAHRGPDSAGEWYDAVAQIGLAHRRLSIIDLSDTGAQPMATADGRVVIVFNGEIYNYRALREDLIAAGHAFSGTSDTEVLLHLYLAHGERMLEMLNGIFAFAIWDARKGELFVARDALGVKPLYICETASGFVFGSELKALLPLVPEEQELDPVALHQYLTYLWSPGERTPLRGVKKVLPGEALIVRDARVTRRWTWYQLPVFRGVRATLGERESIDGTVEHLREAVRRQLVADVPVGAFLSGGLDSSAIVTFAREESPDIRCFTIETRGGTDEGVTDDLPYARRVAQHLGVALDVVTVDADTMAQDVSTMFAQLDEPLADPAPLNVLYISRLARSHGIKVLLSGAGGDDLFTGYRRHLAVSREPLWNWIPSGMRRALDRASAGLDQQRSVTRRASKLLRGFGEDGDARVASYFAWARESELMSLYTPAFRDAIAGTPPHDEMLRFLAPLPKNVPALDRMLALEQRFFLADHNLTYTDKMSMATGVEVRVPFLDLDLVDFAARIPLRLKQRGTQGKWVLKRAMEPYLPSDVIYRSKSGFGAPLRRWMRHELLPLLRETLSAERLSRRGLFDADAVRRLIDRNAEGSIDAAYTLLAILGIELWCDAFLRAAPSTPIQL